MAQDELGAAAGAGIAIVFLLFYLAIFVLFIAAGWKLLTKAGEPGWKVLIPIYNYWTFAEISGRPGWWALLFLIPIVNIVIGVILAMDLAKSFGKDPAFGIGIAFLSIIFIPILAFGDSRYVGPAGPEGRPGWSGPQGYGGYGQGGYGQVGYGQQGYAPQGGYAPPPGQQWGQPSQPSQPQWGQPPQQPSQPQWGQPPQGQGDPNQGSGGYPPPPLG
ncbi:DUF5684 domain-containing protein [Euzebya sp.]|uniref:DUF5684 domain-containing protein n=1 Tax=Euzebya sp. TaxID=1971409 RepID=UPI0035174CDC